VRRLGRDGATGKAIRRKNESAQRAENGMKKALNDFSGEAGGVELKKPDGMGSPRRT